MENFRYFKSTTFKRLLNDAKKISLKHIHIMIPTTKKKPDSKSIRHNIVSALRKNVLI